ncbi:unnamed protein product [Brassicogethes aeneus]|uniref:DUF4817 domain-containing protein n=1 Tax=Brassicogethes aeneus TaxID=1431903 RepID=A0A9P0BEZ8_BRAAE|nr:unnamed protein product [Brassicogethes aeneus]
MHRFSLDQRFEMLKTYFECDSVVAKTARKLRTTKFGRNEARSNQGITNFIDRVRKTGMLVDVKHVLHAHPRRTPKGIAAISESVRLNASTSTRRRSQQLGLSRTTLRRIMHKDLGMFAYKAQLVQELKQFDHPQRFRSAEFGEEGGFAAEEAEVLVAEAVGEVSTGAVWAGAVAAAAEEAAAPFGAVARGTVAVKAKLGQEPNEQIPPEFIRPRKGELRRIRPGESSSGKLGEERIVLYTAKRRRSSSPAERRRPWSGERTRRRSRSLSPVGNTYHQQQNQNILNHQNIQHHQNIHHHHNIWMPPVVMYDPRIHGPYVNMMIPNVRPIMYPHPYPPIFNSRRNQPQSSNHESEEA